MAAIRARLTSIAHHDSGVSLLTLRLSTAFPFRAGQYLNVLHDSGARIPMSIASPPGSLPQLELHFRGLPGVPEAALMDEVLSAAAHGSREMMIEGPFGDVHVGAPTHDGLLLIAGGSGIAQCRAILLHLRGEGQQHPVRQLWSVTRSDQLYCNDEFRGFAPWLSYIALIDAPNSENAAAVWLRGIAAPRSGRVIISGGPGFVYSIVDVLEAIGTPAASIESDVFSYAPRR